MPDDEEWAFEAEIDLWDDGESPTRLPDEDAEQPGLTGQDPDRIVTVTVSDDGEVRRVELAADWKAEIDPRVLGARVLTAANAATIDSVGRRAREVRDSPPSAPPADGDETPLTAQDVLRLTDAVDAELESFAVRVSETTAATAFAESGGGHVAGTAENGHYVSLNLDTAWASSARNAEVESELLDVLTALCRKSAPPGPVPESPGRAYTELMGLLADPARLLRRVGLTPPPGLSAGAEGSDRR
ncbi:YbaB/EbfC family nucleoid-associated protein [Amycolatopsis sp. FBCC-B4732]|uniref:YbaB/EbfC family nucleoid-associated protein n=1 Tax=Amycolatopsis sp. FBCC-B4732 TaxID=3079339 RepID=UPI001FF4B283|nr:YbaB/EbfC family nucleoid-associated protein [Amycolatopsis sp. FBCC-B4732]UOX86426.1 YbaB/EbfC family nucleoid-associated protein [Amycolatopsis sp. FBCC-B4732]